MCLPHKTAAAVQDKLLYTFDAQAETPERENSNEPSKIPFLLRLARDPNPEDVVPLLSSLLLFFEGVCASEVAPTGETFRVRRLEASAAVLLPGLERRHD